jgi:hypothetical protein
MIMSEAQGKERRKMVWHQIQWSTPSLSLLLSASVALVSELGRVLVWGVLKGSKIFSWEASQPILFYDLN